MPTIDQLSVLFKALAHKDLDAAERQAGALSLRTGGGSLEDVVLRPDARSTLEELVEEYKSQAVLRN
jgi:hypothetical protein